MKKKSHSHVNQSFNIYRIARMGRNFDDYPGFQQIPGMPILLQQCVLYFRSWGFWFPCLLLCTCISRISITENWSYFGFWRIPSSYRKPTCHYCHDCRNWFNCGFVIWKILRCVSAKPLLVHINFHKPFANLQIIT